MGVGEIDWKLRHMIVEVGVVLRLDRHQEGGRWGRSHLNGNIRLGMGMGHDSILARGSSIAAKGIVLLESTTIPIPRGSSSSINPMAWLVFGFLGGEVEGTF